MNLPLRYNIAQNTQYYVTPKSFSPSIGKKRYRPGRKCKVRLLINVLVRTRYPKTIFILLFTAQWYSFHAGCFSFHSCATPLQPLPGGEPCIQYKHHCHFTISGRCYLPIRQLVVTSSRRFFHSLAVDRTLSNGVDLAGRSLADVVAGSSTVTDSS